MFKLIGTLKFNIKTGLLLSKISFDKRVSNDSIFSNLVLVDPICTPVE